MIEPMHRRYGTWPSPIDMDIVSKQVVAFEDLAVDGTTKEIFHCERRPSEGRTAIVNTARGGDAIDKPYNARSVVNGFGGGPLAARDGVLFFANLSDSRVYRVDASGITAVTPNRPQWFFADFDVHPVKTHLLVAILEDRTKPHPSTILNSLVLIDTESESVDVIVSGADFYASPKFSPDGTKLAWTCWNHPEMPLDSLQLMIGSFSHERRVVDNQVNVAGEPGRSVAQQPQWVTNTSLVFMHDRSGWALPSIHFVGGETREILTQAVEQDFSDPLWALNVSTFAVLGDTHLFCKSLKNGLPVLHLVNVKTGEMEAIESSYARIRQVRAIGARSVAFIGTKEDKGDEIVKLELGPRCPIFTTLVSSSDVPILPEFIPRLQNLKLSDMRGRILYANYYPPSHPLYAGMSGELPPAVLSIHAGPKYSVNPGFDWTRLFYTSRGWAWIDVMFAGTLGYGREYMARIDGQWGVVDVEDCVSAAQQIAGQGLIDIKRLVTRGGASGGYGVLQSLTSFPEFYAAGSVFSAISDLRRLNQTTIKFLSRGMSRLIGGTEEEIPDVYHARSPLFHSERIKAPVLLVHGKLDNQNPVEQAESIVEAIRCRGGRADLLIFEDEAHGFRLAKNIKAAFEKELSFFEEVLGLKNARTEETATASIHHESEGMTNVSRCHIW